MFFQCDKDVYGYNLAQIYISHFLGVLPDLNLDKNHLDLDQKYLKVD